MLLAVMIFVIWICFLVRNKIINRTKRILIHAKKLKNG
jgi:hypothetical protein